MAGFLRPSLKVTRKWVLSNLHDADHWRWIGASVPHDCEWGASWDSPGEA